MPTWPVCRPSPGCGQHSFPLAVYAVLGSSRQLSVGPESSTTLITAAALGPIAAGDAGLYAASAAALAILVGIICLLGGLARLGFLANLLSQPVLVGYMAGIAIVMMASQLGKITRISLSGHEFYWQLRSFVEHIGGVHWPTLNLAAVVLALQVVLSRRALPLPGPLIALLVVMAAVTLWSLQTKGIAVVGSVPSGLPSVEAPAVAMRIAGVVVPRFGVICPKFWSG